MRQGGWLVDDQHIHRLYCQEGLELVVLGQKVLHEMRGLPRLALSALSEDGALDCYRRVGDEIRRYVETLPAHSA